MKKNKTYKYTFDDLISSEEVDKLVHILRSLVQIPIGIAKAGNIVIGQKDCDESEFFSPICKLIRSSRDGDAACRHTDVKHETQILNQLRGIHYLCHAGLVDFMVPVMIEHQHIATFSGGQLIPGPPSEEGFQKVLSNVKHLGLDKNALREAYFNSPYADQKKINAILELLEFFGNYVAEMGRRLHNAQENQKHSVISDAIEFINDNFRNPISLHDVANHVYLSDSYFSRLFKKVTGDTFTDFVQKIRVGEAKKLLEKTDWSITTIALDVGFSSIHYFNELFRKLERRSPSKFRKQVKNAAPQLPTSSKS
jgi:AraC-like DNA-binding protein/ligand-binding sensor protein